jgi:hypothetical protein
LKLLLGNVEAGLPKEPAVIARVTPNLDKLSLQMETNNRNNIRAKAVIS